VQASRLRSINNFLDRERGNRQRTPGVCLVKIVKRIVLGTLLIAVVFVSSVAAVMYRAYSPGSPVYVETPAVKSIALPGRFRNWDEHDYIVEKFALGKPYVLELSSGKGSFVFFGAHHTGNPNDPQMAQIEQQWKAFKPTVALHEGRQRSFYDVPVLEPLKGLSEVEKLHNLATRSGVKIYTLEPAFDDEVAALLKKWSPEEVATYFVLRGYWSEAKGDVREDIAKELIGKRTDVEGLRGSLKAPSDIDRVWKKAYPNAGDWRTTKGEPEDGYLAEMSDASRVVRGEHMARVLIDLVRRGERVFAVVGSGHVIRTEWILREALGAPSAFDQPKS
jgi:hypothetical protein